MDELPPLEILPCGRTREQQDKLDARKAAGHRGFMTCLGYLVAIALVIVYAAGWMAGRISH